MFLGESLLSRGGSAAEVPGFATGLLNGVIEKTRRLAHGYSAWINWRGKEASPKQIARPMAL